MIAVIATIITVVITLAALYAFMFVLGLATGLEIEDCNRNALFFLFILLGCAGVVLIVVGILTAVWSGVRA